MKRGWIGLTVLLMAVGCSRNDTIDPGPWNSYRNPVEQSDMQDPAICKADGKFFLFTSGSADSVIPIMESSNLTNWSMTVTVFSDETKPTFISGVTPTSPDIAKVGDRYLLYYSMYKSAAASGIGVAESDLATGPFTDKGKLILGSDYGISGAVSPSFFNDGSDNYLVFGNFGGIYLIKLSADGLSVAAGASPVKLASEHFDAPYIMQKEGKFYLFASVGTAAGGADSPCQQVVARADNVTGPYLDRDSRPMTDDGCEVLIKGSTKFAGPGHGCIFTSDDGSDWILYNAYDMSDLTKGRTLMLDHIIWDEGWPSVRGAIGSFCADAPVLN